MERTSEISTDGKMLQTKRQRKVMTQINISCFNNEETE